MCYCHDIDVSVYGQRNEISFLQANSAWVVVTSCSCHTLGVQASLLMKACVHQLISAEVWQSRQKGVLHCFQTKVHGHYL